MNSDVVPSNESRYAKVNWLTAGVLVWFHIQAIAAFCSAMSWAIEV